MKGFPVRNVLSLKGYWHVQQLVDEEGRQKEVGKISSSVRRFKNGSVVIATRNICTKGKRKYST